MRGIKRSWIHSRLNFQYQIIVKRYSNIMLNRNLLFATGRIGRIVVSHCPETDYMQGSVTVG